MKQPAPDRGYVTDIASQMTLPYRKPPETSTSIVRVNGRIRVTIQNSSGGRLPYGKYPRLFELWAATMITMHAPCVDFDTKTLTIDQSFRSFLKRVNVTIGGRTIDPMIDQLKRFFDCVYNIEDDRLDSIAGAVIPITRKYSFAWGCGNRGHVGKGWVQFSDEYFNMLLNDTVPVNLDIIAHLHGAMSLDIYLFLNRRNSYLKQNGTVRISWEDLLLQFGNDGPIWKFRQTFERALAPVTKNWDGLQVFTDNTGVVLLKSPMTVQSQKIPQTQPQTAAAATMTDPEQPSKPQHANMMVTPTPRPDITEGFITRVICRVGYDVEDPIGQRKLILESYGMGLDFEEICERVGMNKTPNIS